MNGSSLCRLWRVGVQGSGKMKIGRRWVALLVVVVLLIATGCLGKKKKPTLPVQAHAPTLNVPLPDEIAEASPAPAPPKAQAEQPPPTPAKPKPQKGHRPRKAPQQTPATQSSSTSGSPPVVATARPPANPAEASPDLGIGADVTRQQLNQQKQTTADLLEKAEKNLKNLNRNLSHDEEAMVTQIRSYVAQSRKATADGDFERAYNLAVKAQLLADALIKQ